MAGPHICRIHGLSPVIIADNMTLFSTPDLAPSRIVVPHSQNYQTGSIPFYHGKSSPLEQFTQPVVNFKHENSVWNKTLMITGCYTDTHTRARARARTHARTC
jgi:hypothetical protein